MLLLSQKVRKRARSGVKWLGISLSPVIVYSGEGLDCEKLKDRVDLVGKARRLGEVEWRADESILKGPATASSTKAGCGSFADAGGGPSWGVCGDSGKTGPPVGRRTPGQGSIRAAPDRSASSPRGSAHRVLHPTRFLPLSTPTCLD